MTRLRKLDFSEARHDIVRSKRTFGILYGIIAGITFACASWGPDGYLLSHAHGYLPWFNLAAGILLCALCAGLLSWLTERTGSSLLGMAFWFISAMIFAWLIVSLPLQIAPFMISKFNPGLGAFLDYSSDIELPVRFGVALAWIAPFTLIIGVTQIPMIEPAVFSTSVFGKIKPFLFCIIVMAISGFISDNLVNAQLRSAITGLDNAIQFVVDNQGNDNLDPALSREIHASALRTVEQYVGPERSLFIGSFDNELGEIHVLVHFDGPWLDCRVLYGQPSTCSTAVEK
ncbi:MAG: hypothetical protein K8S20_03870 [Chloroflexi bacterium]|nr:hypothetical protein [Chloroflexota bacterium]